MVNSAELMLFYFFKFSLGINYHVFILSETMFISLLCVFVTGWHVPWSADHPGHAAAVRAGSKVEEEIY